MTTYDRLTVRADELRERDRVLIEDDVPLALPTRVQDDADTWHYTWAFAASGRPPRQWRYTYDMIREVEQAYLPEWKAMVDSLAERFVMLRLADDRPFVDGDENSDMIVAIQEDQLVQIQRPGDAPGPAQECSSTGDGCTCGWTPTPDLLTQGPRSEAQVEQYETQYLNHVPRSATT